MIMKRIEADSAQAGLHTGRTRGKTNRSKKKKKDFLLDIGKKFTVKRTIMWCPNKLLFLVNSESSFEQVHKNFVLTWNLIFL